MKKFGLLLLVISGSLMAEESRISIGQTMIEILKNVEVEVLIEDAHAAGCNLEAVTFIQSNEKMNLDFFKISFSNDNEGTSAEDFTSFVTTSLRYSGDYVELKNVKIAGDEAKVKKGVNTYKLEQNLAKFVNLIFEDDYRPLLHEINYKKLEISKLEKFKEIFYSSIDELFKENNN